MAKKCIYCKSEVDDNSVIDFCRRCGVGVWGEKMFNTIVESMEKARDTGDLFQGSISDSKASQSSRRVGSFNSANGNSLG